MLVHIKEKIKDIVTDDKRKPFISNRVQRIAIRLISSFFALIIHNCFPCFRLCCRCKRSGINNDKWGIDCSSRN